MPGGVAVKMAISSRTVLKNLENIGEYYTLPQQLAFLDREGYKKVAVVSVNLFPTAEHDLLCKITTAFETGISLAKYQITAPLFSRVKETNAFLNFLNKELRSKYSNHKILFIAIWFA
ncbi:MAG: hypothetical protein MZU97_01610 [Bacillus subtilis]|nr:hypothetical protein [Bacillus subtilis]